VSRTCLAGGGAGASVSPVQVLEPAAVDEALSHDMGWRRQDGQLVKVWRGRDFADALGYVNAVGALAEAVDHHPDIDIRWNTVTLRLSTHSAGGITEADLGLARQIDAMAPPSS
jgi:4a-hydroxytetrahydrobiopterin dehydratase